MRASSVWNFVFRSESSSWLPSGLGAVSSLRLIRASGRWMRWMCCNIGWISKSFPRSRHETNVCKITMKQFCNTQAYINWLDEKWPSRGSAQDGKSLARLCQGWWAPCHLFSGMIFWAYAPYLPNHIQLQVPKFPVSKTTPSEVWGTFLTARLVSGLAWNIANGSGNTMAQHTECFGFAIVFRQCCAAFKQ